MSDKLREAMEKIARHSYEEGYEQAHNDTVENNAGDPEECSGDWFESFGACGYLGELAKGITLADVETPETGERPTKEQLANHILVGDPLPKEETPQDDAFKVSELELAYLNHPKDEVPEIVKTAHEMGWTACSKHRDEEVRRLREKVASLEDWISDISILSEKDETMDTVRALELRIKTIHTTATEAQEVK